MAALGFVKNNPWIQQDRLSRGDSVSDDSSQSGMEHANTNRNVELADAVDSCAFDSDSHAYTVTGPLANGILETEYSPGIVKRLREKFLRLAESARQETEALQCQKQATRRAHSVDNLIDRKPVSVEAALKSNRIFSNRSNTDNSSSNKAKVNTGSKIQSFSISSLNTFGAPQPSQAKLSSGINSQRDAMCFESPSAKPSEPINILRNIFENNLADQPAKIRPRQVGPPVKKKTSLPVAMPKSDEPLSEILKIKDKLRHVQTPDEKPPITLHNEVFSPPDPSDVPNSYQSRGKIQDHSTFAVPPLDTSPPPEEPTPPVVILSANAQYTEPANGPFIMTVLKSNMVENEDQQTENFFDNNVYKNSVLTADKIGESVPCELNLIDDGLIEDECISEGVEKETACDSMVSSVEPPTESDQAGSEVPLQSELSGTEQVPNAPHVSAFQESRTNVVFSSQCRDSCLDRCISLVDDEDLARFLEEEDEFVFEFVGDHGIIHGRSILVSSRRSDKGGTVGFCERSPTVYAYVVEEEMEEVVESVWPSGEEISHGRYQQMCQQMREEYLQKKLEALEREVEARKNLLNAAAPPVPAHREPPPPSTTGGLVNYVPSQLHNADYQLGVTNSWSYGTTATLHAATTDNGSDLDQKPTTTQSDESPEVTCESFSKTEADTGDLLF